MQSSPEQDAIYARAQALAKRMVGTNELQLALADSRKIEATHSRRGHQCDHSKTHDTGVGISSDCDVATLAHYVGVLAWAMGAEPEPGRVAHTADPRHAAGQ